MIDKDQLMRVAETMSMDHAMGRGYIRGNLRMNEPVVDDDGTSITTIQWCNNPYASFEDLDYTHPKTGKKYDNVIYQITARTALHTTIGFPTTNINAEYEK